MRLTQLTAAMCLSAACLFTGAAPAMAQDWLRPNIGARIDSDEAQNRVERGAMRPFREIVATLEDRFGGRYLSHRLFDGQPAVYVVEWLAGDGRRISVRVNASNGAVLDVSG
jgi:hypothetical protein